jgi:hypothetical protein
LFEVTAFVARSAFFTCPLTMVDERTLLAASVAAYATPLSAIDNA